MTCECGRTVSEGTVPAVDYTGQPLPPMCRFCEVALVYSRERRRKETASSEAGKETQA